MHDFDLVTVRQCVCRVTFAGDDFTVHLDGNASCTEPKVIDEVDDRQPVAQTLRLAIDRHLHAAKIEIRSFLYNLGSVW